MPVLTSRARVRLAASAVALALAAFAPLGASSAARASSDVVEYTCSGDLVPAQTVRVRVTLTMPTSAVVGEQFSITWSGTFETGSELKAPSVGLSAGVNLYAHAGISGLTGLTSATGVGALGAITPGQAITLPTVEMKATARNPGTGSVRPGAVNLGTTENDPLIECEPASAGRLSAYPLTVAAGGTDPDPDTSTSGTPTSSGASDDEDSSDSSEDTSERETTRERSSAVPKAGAETGGGGEAGPDGRALVLGGSALIMAAGIGGLLTRRPRRATGRG
ncbi:hypothetical protein HTZ77_35680 [Nonomuraea sp. SMC257]|uniref:LPXTG cell wall anchor domain-containing protein n=1 Tax=Nonomuraea montanisoli TaxID=2741721 RepID=A0A7Y6M7I1_9ACTN|nr:hypothetical protein [Nonomuraea montanisoli]NUW36710.1 hypothetical protein [Nonomuraea montanisoli]